MFGSDTQAKSTSFEEVAESTARFSEFRGA